MSVFVVSSSHYRYSCCLAVNSGFFPVEITTISEDIWQVCGELFFLYWFVVLFKSSCLMALGGTLSRTNSDNNLTSSPCLISEYKCLANVTSMVPQWCYVCYTPMRAGQRFNYTFFFKWQKSRNMEEAPQSKYLELWRKRKHAYYSVMKTLVGNVPTCRVRDTKMFQNILLKHSSQSYRQTKLHAQSNLDPLWIICEKLVGRDSPISVNIYGAKQSKIYITIKFLVKMCVSRFILKGKVLLPVS